MDIGSAFTYMFDDEDWLKKLAIGGGILAGGVILLPVLLVGLLLMLPLSGYWLQVIQNVRDGNARPMPQWTDFGDLFMKGLMVFLIGLIYNLPVILLSCVAAVPQVMSNPELGIVQSEDTATMLILVAACLQCIQFLISLACNFFVPAAIIRYAQDEAFGSAFQFGALFSFISNNIGEYIIAVILAWVAGIIAGFGVIACIIGVFFTWFWGQLVSANLYGQLARNMAGGNPSFEKAAI